MNFPENVYEQNPRLNSTKKNVIFVSVSNITILNSENEKLFYTIKKPSYLKKQDYFTDVDFGIGKVNKISSNENEKELLLIASLRKIIFLYKI